MNFREKILVGPKCLKGFTIVELLITMAIIAITAGIATPNILQWIANSRLDGAARNLLFNFQHAKMEAAKRATQCTVTFNLPVSGTTYDYVVYVDADQDLEYDAGSDRILKKIKFSNHSEYKGVSFDTNQGGGDGLTFSSNDNGRPSVAFNSRGLSMNNAFGSGAGSVYLTNNNNTKQIRVSTAGSVRIQ